ncbi:MAG: MFS transporter [Candidatus Bathyarchaeota archaeon]|nr:MFS transporter [Candidatus Bathyarchaeota archaeon]
MESDNQIPLYLTYFHIGVAQGILGTLIPLYLIQGLGANLLDLGVMTFAASALLIPASVLLGALPDRNRTSKPYLLLSFLAASILIYLMASTSSILIFQLFYIALELANYIRGPSTSVLIAETFERKKRGEVIAREGFIEGIGAVIGLGLCALLIGLVGFRTLLFLACPLTLASFLIAFFYLRDSPLYIERSFDRFENVIGRMEDFSIHLTDDGSVTPDSGGAWKFNRSANMKFFALGRAVFAFAASNAFTTLSIFLLTRVGFTSSLIFVVFLVRSVFGALSYLFIDRIFGSSGGAGVKVGTILRVVVVLMIPFSLVLPMPYSLIFMALTLSLVAVSWSIYSVGAGLVTILYAQPGSLGLYDALASAGGALGSYSGGLIPTMFGFEMLFLFSGALFLVSLILFYLAKI